MPSDSNVLAPRDALAAMPKELKAIVEPVRARIQSLGKSTLETFHALGKVVDEVMTNEARFGSDAMGQMAAVFDMSKSSLQQARNVSKAFSDKVLAQMIARPLPNGKLLTQSHLVAIAELPDDKARAKAIQTLFETGATVQALKDSSPKGGGSGGRPQRTPADLPSAVEQFRREIHRFKGAIDVAKEHAIDPLKVITQADADTELLEAVLKVCDGVNLLADELTGIQTALRSANTGVVARLRGLLGVKDSD